MPVARRRSSWRSRGSIHARPWSRAGSLSRNGSAGSRLTSSLTPAIVTVSVLGAFVAVSGPGRVIATAVLRFLLYYGGVFALIALTASVGIGLVATDRIIMKPGHRITAQAVHRVISLAAMAFLIVHIWLEIAAARSHMADAVVPFLARQRTFYIGLGTIASDLLLLILASGFLRSWFAGFSRPWAWRAVHSSSYLAWLLSIIHGLLGGRQPKPYVDWSYGACLAAVALALTVRMVATHRSREEVALAAAGPSPAPAGWQSLGPALAQAGVSQVVSGPPAVRALPAGSLPGPAAPLPTGGRAIPAPVAMASGLRDAQPPPAAAQVAWPAGPHGMELGAPGRSGPALPRLDAPAGEGLAAPAREGLAAPAGEPSRWDIWGASSASGRPAPPAWDGASPARPPDGQLAGARSPWDDLGPDPSPWQGLRPDPSVGRGLSRARSPWDDLGPDPSPWQGLRPDPSVGRGFPRERSPWDDLGPDPSPWDGLRPKGPPQAAPPSRPAGPPSPSSSQPGNPLPRRVPGAARTYTGPPL